MNLIKIALIIEGLLLVLLSVRLYLAEKRVDFLYKSTKEIIELLDRVLDIFKPRLKK